MLSGAERHPRGLGAGRLRRLEHGGDGLFEALDVRGPRERIRAIERDVEVQGGDPRAVDRARGQGSGTYRSDPTTPPGGTSVDPIRRSTCARRTHDFPLAGVHDFPLTGVMLKDAPREKPRRRPPVRAGGGAALRGPARGPRGRLERRPRRCRRRCPAAPLRPGGARRHRRLGPRAAIGRGAARRRRGRTPAPGAGALRKGR